MGDLIDAGAFVSIEVIAVIGFVWAFFAYLKDPSYGFEVFSWTCLLVLLFYWFPNFMGTVSTLALGAFFIYGALRR